MENSFSIFDQCFHIKNVNFQIFVANTRGWNERSPGRQMRTNFSSGNQVFWQDSLVATEQKKMME